ncbi:Aste57867_462 [Aphanomyces stellatus]|uniref:Aste57867_462 protein n=1 Tax=Aphanomyces stellatus TaxID=120398 RepID=A0A485K3V7_9STRA|nr:hypothetical protein As57867_000461 [Aphanomyces stellatus]VFT77687.1 Aste57867_462 [Aphanomyces stellatus]
MVDHTLPRSPISSTSSSSSSSPSSSPSTGGAHQLCFFNGCTNLAKPDDWRCAFHRARARCKIDGCNSQVYARRLCVKHGGKKQCQVDGCDRNVRLGTLCTRHAGPMIKKKCSEPDCPNLAHNYNKCVRHGGGRKCKFGGCLTHARSGGYCCRHTRIVKENAAEMMQHEHSLEDVDAMLEPLSWLGSMKLESDVLELASLDWAAAVDDILVKSTGWTHMIGADDDNASNFGNLWC